MRFAAIALATLLLTACQTAPENSQSSSATGIHYSGGDGTTPDSAVVITGARGSSDGVPAEYAWVESNLPGAKVESTALVRGARIYDVFEVTLATGEKRNVYFDISSFFGTR